MESDKIRLQFLGATGYVTGSRTLIETNQFRVYVDAGLYQGPKYIEEKNYKTLESDPKTINAIFLTHAHIDHSGLIPLLVKKGFTGKIFCTPSTYDLLEILLLDAGRLQDEEFRFLSKKKIVEYRLNEALYNEDDARNSLQYFETVPFDTKFTFKGITASFHWNGHILGAACVKLEINQKSFLFSGDIGPKNTVLHKSRNKPPGADYIIMESTYGDRKHDDDDFYKKMIEAVMLIVRKKGILLIPAFAVGRTQLILYVLYRLLQDDKIPHLPIFIDSPMATKATRVYLKYPEEIAAIVIKDKFFEFINSKNIHLIEDVIGSKRLNFFNGPAIIISASGMCSGGRIVHHIFNRIWDRRNTMLFVGYQAEGTLGRKLVRGSARIKLFNRELPVRASIKSIDAFSAHADQTGLIEWLGDSCRNQTPENVFIIHGEEESRHELKHVIKFIDDEKIILPRTEEVFYI
ncbi:MAG: MBL fold metallo-hydrolase [Spirochaetia bacterium]|nr:MBL fold metallo-hydrolase [Spirochaetia bacterium]